MIHNVSNQRKRKGEYRDGQVYKKGYIAFGRGGGCGIYPSAVYRFVWKSEKCGHHLQLEKALDNKCMFDGSSIDGFARMEESDMYLYPDLDTLVIFPWRPQQGKVARLICDVYRPDRTPFEGDPRYILKKVLGQAADMGYRFDVGPECEFFLFHTDDDGLPTTITRERAGYFDLGPMDLGENVRRDIVLTLEEMGFEVESSHHEMAPGQHEIDFRYDDALNTADNIMTFKLAVIWSQRLRNAHQYVSGPGRPQSVSGRCG